MKTYKKIIIIINLILLLVLFNRSIVQKESLITDGKLLLLELVPVDPRSLMQGDFMRLRYAISQNTSTNNKTKRGFCVVKLNENGIAQQVRLQALRTPLHEKEYLIEYTTNSRAGINIGAESYFFQEGDGDKYGVAKFGGLKVDDQGNSILVGLYNKDGVLIQ